jgi:flagellar protein FliS
MSSNAALRDKYRSDSVQTMSPGRLIVALYDRLLLDLDRAIAAIGLDNLVASHAALIHAQEIIGELHDSLDVGVWSPGRQLADIYVYVASELVAANVTKDVSRIQACRSIIEPLRDAWYEAAGLVPDGPGAIVA